MRWLMDALLVLVALLTAPIWLVRMISTGKIKTDWPGRLGRTGPLPAPSERPRILIHAVSVGEVNAIRVLVSRLSESGVEPVVAVTTDTGFARATSLFGDHHDVVRYPLDFSFAVTRFLRSVNPQLAVFVELEVWPNFTAVCERRHIPIVVVNGRLSARSFKKYRLVAPVVQRSFRRLTRVAAQSQAYADRFIALGTPPDRVLVTGTMKWDAVEVDVDAEAVARLAESMGIDRDRPLVVAGSTAPGEHELLHAAVPGGVQLLCAPRRPEWFDAAATALPGCARRSRGDRGSPNDRFLLDTIGELPFAYALADVVVVGRSFGALHGSDMMEPAGLGKPIVVGPAVADFEETVNVLLEADGLIQTSAKDLPATLRKLLDDPDQRRQLAENARRAIAQRRGATDRNLRLILGELG